MKRVKLEAVKLYVSLQRPPDPLAVLNGKLKTAAPFLFAHPVNRFYSFVQLSIVQEFIGRLEKYVVLLTALTKLLHLCGSSLIPHRVSSPDLAPSDVQYHFSNLAGDYAACSIS